MLSNLNQSKLRVFLGTSQEYADDPIRAREAAVARLNELIGRFKGEISFGFLYNQCDPTSGDMQMAAIATGIPSDLAKLKKCIDGQSPERLLMAYSETVLAS